MANPSRARQAKNEEPPELRAQPSQREFLEGPKHKTPFTQNPTHGLNQEGNLGVNLASVAISPKV